MCVALPCGELNPLNEKEDNPMETPRYLVATNNPVLQAALTCLLAEHGDVDTAISCRDLIMTVSDYRPKHYALIFISDSFLDKTEVDSVPLLHHYYTHAPIVGIGTLPRKAHKKACFRAGMQQVVTQPVTREMIAQLIKTYAI